MINTEEFKALRRLCILTLVETIHLRKLLVSHGVIPQDSIYDYANSLSDYMNEIDSKNRNLIKDFPKCC